MKNINTLPDPQLQQWRKSLDNLDNALIFLLAERFNITQQVGVYKRDNTIPAQDPAREASQLKRVEALAIEAGLDPVFAAKILRFIIDEVVANHKKIKEA